MKESINSKNWSIWYKVMISKLILKAIESNSVKLRKYLKSLQLVKKSWRP